MTTPLHRLTDIARTQLGCVSRDQAHRAGVTDDQLRAQVRAGALVQTGPHSFRAALAPVSARVELESLVLDIGPPCWIAGATAAALLGADGFRVRRPYVVAVLRDRNVRRIGVIVRTTCELPLIDRTVIDGLPVTSAARTLIDLARDHSPAQLAAVLDSGLRDGRLSEDLLHRRIVELRSRGRFGIPALLEVLEGRELTRGGHSWLEREFLRRCGAARLPRPSTQQVLAKAHDRLVRVDCRFDGTPVVVELLGYRWHRTRADLARDTERVNALVLAGFVVLQFTYDQVVGDPDGVIRLVRRALLDHRER